MLLHQLAVHPYFGFAHDGLKVEYESLPLPDGIGVEVFSVPYFTLVIHTTARIHREMLYAVRQGSQLPVTVIKIKILSTLHMAFVHSPCGVHGISISSCAFYLKEAGCREMWLIGSSCIAFLSLYHERYNQA